MTASPVALAPPQYAGASLRPDLMQAAGSYAMAAAAPGMMAQAPYDYKTLPTRIEMFEAAEDASRKARELAERDVDYYHNKQWTEDEATRLRKRGQPVISFNLIRQKIDFLQGLERSQRTKPRALPRTPVEEDDAHAVTDALTFVADENRYAQSRSKVWGDVLSAGWGGIEVSAEEVANPGLGQPKMRIIKRRCAWDRMFWDPYSSEEDFSDASYRGMVRWMDRDAAVREYGDDAGKVYDETVSGQQIGGTYDDKPRITTWMTNDNRRRIRVVQMYHIDAEGQWSFCEFTKGGMLRAGVSPWLDKDGNRVHPYVWRSAYVDRDNNRYGAIRDLIDPQDEINKRRSKSLHHFTARQTFGTPEAQGGMNIRQLREQLARPDGHVQLPSNAQWGVNFGIIPTTDQAQGHFNLLQQATQAFEVMGPNAAMQGKSSQDQSGRAILAQQQGGSVQMSTLTDTLRDMDHEVYLKVWNGIRQFWTGETWIRVTDDEKNLRWVGLNEPQVDPQTGQVVVDPMTGQPVVPKPLGEIDIDIILDEAPDQGTLQTEQFEILAQLKQWDAQGEIPFRALVSAVPGLRGKAELLKAMDEQRDQAMQAQQAQAPVQEAALANELQNKQADTMLKAANARKSEAQAQQILTADQIQQMQSVLAGMGYGGVQ